MARSEPGLVRVLTDEVELVRSYWMMNHADTRDVARIKWVADFIRTEAQRDPGFWKSDSRT